MSYLHFRSESIKGDTIVILPSLEGKRQVFYFTAKDLQHFYDLIHRSRLELEKSIKLTNYKKDNPE